MGTPQIIDSKDINDGQASMPFWTICGKVDRDTSIVKLVGRIAGGSSYLLVHFLILYTCIESHPNYGPHSSYRQLGQSLS